MLGLRLGTAFAASTNPQSSFSPASFFGASDQGFVFDFSSASTLFQDSAGTTPVTTATQPIGKVLDISGKGNHATQATAGARPTWQSRAVFDGVDDNLASGSINLANSTLTIVCSVLVAAAATGTIVANAAGASGLTGGYAFRVNSILAANAPPTGSLSDGTAQSVYFESAAGAPPRTKVYTALLDNSAAVGLEVLLRGNGVALALSAGVAGPVATNALANSAQGIGAVAGATFFNGSIYRLLLINRILSGTEIAKAETWAGVPAGISL